MSARLIIHIVVTLILFAIGWWLYVRLEDNSYDAINSVSVATYWFAMLVYVFFSWILYWIVHWFRLRAWVIAQIIAIVIAAVATGTLLYISTEHQKQLEEKAMLEEKSEQATNSATDQGAGSNEEKIQTLNLSEENPGASE
ncbi:MAG: hypothetical protein ACRBDX_02190 [Gammaproteobacteria bacterium]